jgi:hypothetical protein
LAGASERHHARAQRLAEGPCDARRRRWPSAHGEVESIEAAREAVRDTAMETVREAQLERK